MPARHDESTDLDPGSLRLRFKRLLSSARFEYELYLLCGVLLGLCLCFLWIERAADVDTPGPVSARQTKAGFIDTRRLSDVRAPRETGSTVPAAHAVSRFTFVREPSAIVQLASLDMAAKRRLSAPETHFLLANRPGVDPLGAALVSGLPEGSVFSHGLRFGDQKWAIGFGTLDKLVIDLPPGHGETVRALVDLRSREGIVMHSFEVELRTGQRLVEPALVSEELSPKSKKQKKQGRQKPLVVPVVIKPALSGKSKPSGVSGVAKVWPGDPAGIGGPPAANLVPAPLFKPDPKDTPASGLTRDERDDPRAIIMRGLDRPSI